MPSSSRFIRLTVLFRPTDYRPFACATRRLQRIMGPEAPDVTVLIQANLRGRDARGLADDYLDTVDWPMAERRPKFRIAPARYGGRPVVLRRCRSLEAKIPAPADPNRN